MQYNTTALLFLCATLAGATGLPAQDVPAPSAVEVKEQAARDFERLRQAKMAQVIEEHEERVAKIQQEFEANMKTLRSEAIIKQFTRQNESLERAKCCGPIAVYIQFRPQSDQQHALHILTADGQSVVYVAREDATVEYGQWSKTVHGIKFSVGSASGTSLTCHVLLKSAGVSYVSIDAADQLQDIGGRLLFGDPSFLSQTEGNMSGGKANHPMHGSGEVGEIYNGKLIVAAP